MANDEDGPGGPDLAQGVALAELADGGACSPAMWATRRCCWCARARQVFAVGAHCTHYHAPLVDGLVVGATLRCPGITPRFDLASGEALRAPGPEPARTCWSTVERDGKIFVRDARRRAAPSGGTVAARRRSAGGAGQIVIVGGGAAGFAAAEMLRRAAIPGQHRHAQPRRRCPRRPAEPVEGLSRRQRA